ncbi:ras GEF [Auriculariales sp. MPI-PUGE-AT-0066]|nr:ras GEF [Auriculariales sp. MPI-PUGE-AT-0066]
MSTPPTADGPSPELTTLFCRALYDYVSPDANSLSFKKGDIVEVLTQLGSGWWDGIVRGERGWFPSNFTEPISEQEAIEDFARRQSIPAQVAADVANVHEYWMPQVTADGQIYYVNTQTGERANDLPTEPDPDDSSTYYPTDSSADGSSQGRPSTSSAEPRTPEPWQKRLAEDGSSYYYFNKADGTISWQRPADTPGTSLNSDSDINLANGAPENRRLSVYSDTSEVYPGLAEKEMPQRRPITFDSETLQALEDARGPSMAELMPAVRAALLEVAKVVDSGEDFGREARLTSAAWYGAVPQTTLHAKLMDVVSRTRDLLHTSGAAYAGGALKDVWKNTIGGEPRPPPGHVALPHELKATQRKVAATLSKLVLSARAAGHHPNSLGDGAEDVRGRLGKDASDLESAIRGFMGEWESACFPLAQPPPGEKTLAERRRLRAGFDYEQGLLQPVGAGNAGMWSAWGYTQSSARGGVPSRPFDHEAVNDASTALQVVVDEVDQLRASQEGVSARGLLAAVQQLAESLIDIDLGGSVDVEGPSNAKGVDANEWAAYQQTVQRANDALKRLELATQGLFDGANSILMRAQALDNLEDSELEALVADGRTAHDALNTLLGISQAQASSQLRRVRDTDSTTIAASHDDGASVRTGDTVVPSMQQRGSVDVSSSQTDEEEESEEEFLPKRPRKNTSSKLADIFGTDIPDGLVQSDEPAFMGPSYGPNDIILVPEGVRAATLPALIERLTLHKLRDAIFIDSFMLTFKSFATPDQVLDHLIQRFFIQPPEGLSQTDFHYWAENKQKVIQLRVINILTIMLKDGVLDKEDMPLLKRFKEFAKIAQDEIGSAAQPLLNVVERARSGSDARPGLTFANPEMPPPPQMPKNLKKMKPLDLDAIELARQLTILESGNFNSIKLLDCLQRAGEQSSTGAIKNVIETQTQMSFWVVESILNAGETPKQRTQVLRQFINIAEQCKNLNNFSSMTAIVAGVNNSAIRRLKRTWEPIQARQHATLDAMEKVIETARNFQTYKAAMAKIQPPAVPFLGVYLTALLFIQEGNKDMLPNPNKDGPPLINFQKRHTAGEVLREIKRFQNTPYNLTQVQQVTALIDVALKAVKINNDTAWNLSMELEPREREEEKVQRLLQDSGFV